MSIVIFFFSDASDKVLVADIRLVCILWLSAILDLFYLVLPVTFYRLALNLCNIKGLGFVATGFYQWSFLDLVTSYWKWCTYSLNWNGMVWPQSVFFWSIVVGATLLVTQCMYCTSLVRAYVSFICRYLLLKKLESLDRLLSSNWRYLTPKQEELCSWFFLNSSLYTTYIREDPMIFRLCNYRRHVYQKWALLFEVLPADLRSKNMWMKVELTYES